MDQTTLDFVHYEKRILLCVTGLSPQVVTETLYALVTEHKVFPTEIRLITTKQGRDRAIVDLLTQEKGHFFTFCQDYTLTDKISFDESYIHVITDKEGNPLSDIRTPEENLIAADAITNIVRQLCMDKQSALHVSIAGGRKTMGFFLGYALSLFARPQDQLSHVLVSEPYENNRDFFYPSQKYKELIGTDGKILDASQAKVMLATIPLVRLRDRLPSFFLDQGTYSETVQAVQNSIRLSVELKFNLQQREILCAGQTIKLPPVQFALLLWMASRKKNLKQLSKTSICLSRDEDLIVDFLKFYKLVTPTFSLDYENAVKLLKTSLEFSAYFRSARSRLHRTLKKHLGFAANSFYIHSFGKRPFTYYELATPSDAILLPEESIGL